MIYQLETKDAKVCALRGNHDGKWWRTISTQLNECASV